MGTKKFKWGNPLFVAFLAVAGIFGVSSAVVNKQAEEIQPVEKAEAYDAGRIHGQVFGDSNWHDVSGHYNSTSHEVVFKHVYFTAGSYFGFYANNDYKKPWIDNAGASSCFSGGEEKSDLYCNTTGWYDVYLKPNDGKNSVYFAYDTTDKYTIYFDYSAASSSYSTKRLHLCYSAASVGTGTDWQHGLVPTSDSAGVATFTVPTDVNKLVFYDNVGVSSSGHQAVDIDSGFGSKTYFVSADTNDTGRNYIASIKAGYYLLTGSDSWTTVGKRSSDTSYPYTWDFDVVIDSHSGENHKFQIRYYDGHSDTATNYYGSMSAGDATTKFYTYNNTVIANDVESGTFTVKLLSGNTLRVDDADDNVPSSGYYLAGNSTFINDIGKSGLAWKFDTGYKMSAPVSGTDLAKVEHISLSSGASFYVKQYNGTIDSIRTVNYGTYASDFVDISSKVVTVKEGASGPFTIGVNSEGNAYVLPDAYSITAYAFFFQGSVSEPKEDISSTLTGIYKYGRYQMDYYPEPFNDGYNHNSGTYYLEGWYLDEELTEKIVNIPSVTSNQTLYGKFVDQTYYTISYRYVLNGVYMSDWGTGSVKGLAGSGYNTLTEPSVYGMEFEGWYSDSSCNTGLGTSTITDNVTVYAKFTSRTDNNTFFVSMNDSHKAYLTGGSIPYVWYQRDGGDFAQAKSVPGLSIGKFNNLNVYQISVPDDASWFMIHGGLANGSSREGYRTTSQVDGVWGEHNLFNITGYSTDYIGDWVDCVINIDISEDSEFTSPTSYQMTESSDLSSQNLAEYIGFETIKDYYFRVSIVATASGTLFSQNFYTIGTNTETTNVAIPGATSSDAPKFKNNETIEVYLKDSTIYLLGESSIESGGFLYLATDDDPSTLKVTVSFTASSGTVYPYSLSTLDKVRDVLTTTTLKFNGKDHLYIIPIYNLRGNKTPTGSTYSVAFTNGSDTSSFTLPVSTTEPHYTITLYDGSLSSADDQYAKAAIAAYQIDLFINATANNSVCEISIDDAKDLCKLYDAGNASLLANSTINTWAGSSASGDKADWGLDSIRYQLGQKAGGSYAAFAKPSVIFSWLLNDNNNISTIIIIVASSVALLSVTALSILVIKKRKAKED